MEDVTDVALCDACYFVEKSAFAGTFCIDCDQKLCTECQLYHTKFPATREHRIVKLKEMTVNMIENPQNRSLLDLSRCDYHELKDVKYFCYDHKEVYCSLCRAVKHATCNEKPIVEICGILETKDLENVLVTLDQLAGGLDKARHDRQRQIHEMETTKNNCIQEILSLKQRIAMLFDQLDKNAGQKIVEVDRRVKEFAEKATLYDDAMNHVSSLSHQVRQVFECGDKEAIFTAQTKARKLKADYTILVEQYKIDLAPMKLVLNQDAQLIDILSTCESLGEVNLQPAPDHRENAQMVPSDMVQLFLSKKTEYTPQVTTRIAPVQNQEMTGTLSPPPPLSLQSPASVKTRVYPRPLYSQIGNHTERKNSSSSSSSSTSIRETRKSFLNIKLKHRKHYPINMKEDKGDCDITGLACWPSGNLVICDHYNKTVKILDQNYQVIHCKRLGDHPWDVTVIGSDEVAVTLTKTKTVKFLEISSDRMYFSGSFQTKKMCWGIEAFHDSMIITFHDKPGNGCVEIRSRKGEVLQQISNGDDENSLFISPYYVALDSTKERFFVSDGKNNSVICCTIDGKVHSVAKTENLRWPKGIVVDEDSNMLVSAHFVDQLKLLKTKRQGGYVKFCDIQRPQALAFRWDDLSLVVGTNEGKEITVLTFENK